MAIHEKASSIFYIMVCLVSEFLLFTTIRTFLKCCCPVRRLRPKLPSRPAATMQVLCRSIACGFPMGLFFKCKGNLLS
jgi:hypothetical protein